MSELTICFAGPLRVTDAQGRDNTPKATRVRALLALIAEPPLRKHGRRWLAAHLWSDRPFEKSRMSLRQALVELRKAFGDASDVIYATRTDIWLDPERVRSDLARPHDHDTLPLLEGLDVPDEAFEEWLRDLRMHHETPASEAPTGLGDLKITSKVGAASSDAGRVTAGVIADQVSQNLEDMLGSTRAIAGAGRSDIEITTYISETNDSALLSAQVVYGPANAVLYSGHQQLSKKNQVVVSLEEIAAFSHNAAARALAKLPHVAAMDRDEIIALGHAETARRRLFSYQPGEVEAAGALFKRAFDADPSGVFLAWQAFQRTARVLECMAEPSPSLREEADEMLRRAAEFSPESAQIHALTSLVRLLLFDDLAAALAAAEAALRRNPSCLLSNQAMAMTAGAFGDKNAAYRASSFCRPALAMDDARHLWDLYHGLVCISTDRLNEAYAAIRGVSQRSPSFKAPHRQMIALSLHLGEPDRARQHLSALQSLEPGFALDAYILDQDYPVTTLRNAGLLEQSFETLM